MKNFLKLIVFTLFIGFLSSCNKESDQLNETKLISNADFIDAELRQYSNDNYIDIKSVRNALISFDQTLVKAKELSMTNEDEIASLYLQNAKSTGLTINDSTNNSTYEKIPSVPTDLIKILGELVDTANANSIEEYISNLEAFEVKVRGSKLKLIEKGGILASVLVLKITAKLIKKYPPKWLNDQTANEKWVKQLKCAFYTIAVGISGALTGCSQGSAIISPIGGLGGVQGAAIGSLVGCTIGALIKGIINMVEGAQTCISKEGL